MRLGLGLSLSQPVSGGGGASNPTFDAQDFTGGGSASYWTIDSATVMGAARDSSTGSLRGNLDIALDPGTYRLRGDLTAWTGIGGVTGIDLRILNSSNAALTMDSGAQTYSVAGAVDSVFTLASATTLRLRPNQTGRGFTFTAQSGTPILEKTA